MYGGDVASVAIQYSYLTSWLSRSSSKHSQSAAPSRQRRARTGFGVYPGFLSEAFFPIFGDGNTIPAVLVSSVALWLFHFMILRGIKGAAAINTIVTVAKVIPILVFIVILIAAFEVDLFRANFWGGESLPETGLIEQVRATMLVTVFVFIGIEGALIYIMALAGCVVGIYGLVTGKIVI